MPVSAGAGHPVRRSGAGRQQGPHVACARTPGSCPFSALRGRHAHGAAIRSSDGSMRQATVGEVQSGGQCLQVAVVGACRIPACQPGQLSAGPPPATCLLVPCAYLPARPVLRGATCLLLAAGGSPGLVKDVRTHPPTPHLPPPAATCLLVQGALRPCEGGAPSSTADAGLA